MADVIQGGERAGSMQKHKRRILEQLAKKLVCESSQPEVRKERFSRNAIRGGKHRADRIGAAGQRARSTNTSVIGRPSTRTVDFLENRLGQERGNAEIGRVRRPVRACRVNKLLEGNRSVCNRRGKHGSAAAPTNRLGMRNQSAKRKQGESGCTRSMRVTLDASREKILFSLRFTPLRSPFPTLFPFPFSIEVTTFRLIFLHHPPETSQTLRWCFTTVTTICRIIAPTAREVYAYTEFWLVPKR